MIISSVEHPLTHPLAHAFCHWMLSLVTTFPSDVKQKIEDGSKNIRLSSSGGHLLSKCLRELVGITKPNVFAPIGYFTIGKIMWCHGKSEPP